MPVKGGGVFLPLAAAPTYAGPGDVVPNALVWFGLRAYSAATVGTAAIRLIRSSDSAQSDFNTLSTGALDTASISSFIGGGSATVAKWYDQSGNSRDATGGATKPALPLGPPPAVVFNGSALLQFSLVAAHSQPFSFSSVSNRTDATNATALLWQDDIAGVPAASYGSDPTCGITVSAPTPQTMGATLALPRNQLNALQVLFNSISGASARANGNSFSTGSSIGTNTIPSSAGGSIDIWTNNAVLTIQQLEFGFWDGDKSTLFASLETNQRTFWGF
jgi:hypothetical protein